MRFYGLQSKIIDSTCHYYAQINDVSGNATEIEIDCDLYDALVDLQREHWKLDKREQRHTVHLDAIPECYLPQTCYEDNPETILIDRLIREDVSNAFSQIPVKQQRRLVLRHIYDLPIKEIAKIEGCSERSIKYSLKLGKDNLRDILGKDFLVQSR